MKPQPLDVWCGMTLVAGLLALAILCLFAERSARHPTTIVTVDGKRYYMEKPSRSSVYRFIPVESVR